MNKDWHRHTEFYSKPIGLSVRWEIYAPNAYSPIGWGLRRVEYIDTFDSLEEAVKYAEDQTETKTQTETAA